MVQTTPRLTQFSHGAGCGCKLAPGALADVLSRLPVAGADDLLVGTGDDAAVWRLSPERALVATIDVITPIVDDAATWGRIAATNAASDVYAMGATPLFGLNFVGWNHAALGDDLLVELLTGASQTAADGGWVVVGGHSVDDPEPKFGVAVVGEVHPEQMLAKAGARVGDALVLTKPLGVGLAVTALKGGVVAPEVIEAAIASMLRSNAEAAREAVSAGASACTDVTGFGLLGHARSLAESSRVDLHIDVAAVSVLAGSRELVEQGHVPGGAGRNLAWAEELLDRGTVDEVTLTILADPQTSGGLLFTASPEQADAAVRQLRGSGHDAAVIGTVAAGSGRTRLI